MKLKFLKNYSPNKKGETKEFKTPDELKIADFYIRNQIAKQSCKGCDENKEGDCEECNKKRGVVTASDFIEDTSEKKVATSEKNTEAKKKVE